jgi:hypothetical protein
MLSGQVSEPTTNLGGDGRAAGLANTGHGGRAANRLELRLELERGARERTLSQRGENGPTERVG